MAKVKIFLEDGETIEDAKESLEKALKADETIDHAPDDPVMKEIYDSLEQRYEEMLKEAEKEILALVKKELK